MCEYLQAQAALSSKFRVQDPLSREWATHSAGSSYFNDHGQNNPPDTPKGYLIQIGSLEAPLCQANINHYKVYAQAWCRWSFSSSSSLM